MISMKELGLLISLILVLLLATACSTNPSSTAGVTEEKPIDKKALADINLQLAVAYLQRGNTSRAKEKLLAAQQQDPKAPAVWYTTGYFYEKTGDLQQADEAYHRSVKLSPKSGAVQNNYGTFLCRQGKYQEAIKHFLLAIQDQSYLDTAFAYENAGLCALKVPDKKQAGQYFQEALLHNPNLPTSLLQMAQINYERGNYAAAKENLARYNAIAQPNIDSMQLAKKLAKTR